MGAATEVVEKWSIESYAAHNEALRIAEEKLQTERDRRYAEVKAAEEKALLVKQRADDQALSLAREIQTYKDEKANELREQIGRERGMYATKADIAAITEKFEALNKPVVEFMAQAMGRGSGMSSTWSMIALGVSLLIGLLALGSFAFKSSGSTPQVIVVPAPVVSPPTQTTTTTIPAVR